MIYQQMAIPQVHNTIGEKVQICLEGGFHKFVIMGTGFRVRMGKC